MSRKKVIIIAIVAAVLLGCVVGVILLTAPSGNGDDPSETTGGTAPSANPEGSGVSTDPTVLTQPGEATIPTQPGDTTDPSDPTDPVEPTDPADPIDPSDPSDPTDPTDPDLPVEDPNQHQKVEIFVSREDGSPAQGAAVIATHSSGRQEYEPTDENGVAVLYLPKGKHSLRVLHDGQHGNAEVEIDDAPIKKNVQLKDQRTLYIFLGASGGYDVNPNELTHYSTFEKAIKDRYPDAVYLTPENRYDVEFRDGDALLSVEVFIENYTSSNQYFASEVWIHFNTYQECLTVWDTDEAGEEIDIEYADGNMCSVRVRNEYDYEYKNSVSVITESYYMVQKDWHLRKSSNRADPWGYDYMMDIVLTTGTERRIKAPGAGTKAETFWFDVNSNRFSDYLMYTEQVYPYVDLWMSEKWNEEIEQLASKQ